MKFKELQEKINVNELEIKDIEFKIPSILLQRDLIENILKSSMLEEDDNGLKKFDYVIFAIFKLVAIVESFTNIEIEILKLENGIKVFDFIAMSEIYDVVVQSDELISKLDDISYDFSELLSISMEQEISLANSLESILAKGINKIVTKFPDNKELGKLVNKIPTLINKIDSEKMNFIQKVVGVNKGVTRVK